MHLFLISKLRLPIYDKQPSHRTNHKSFNAKTGEQESIQPMWENSTFNRMERSKGKISERPLSFIGKEAERSGPQVHQKEEAIVIVDPFSTGAHLAKQCYEAGYKVRLQGRPGVVYCFIWCLLLKNTGYWVLHVSFCT